MLAHLAKLFCWILFTCCVDTTVFEVSPPYDVTMRAALKRYRLTTQSVQLVPYPSKCGIVWTLATVTDSQTDLEYLLYQDHGIGYNRLMSVTFEVFQAAARAKHAIQLNQTVPAFCEGDVKLILYADRILFHSGLSISPSLLTNAQCIFDTIVYFDQLPLHVLPWSASGNISDSSKRLSSRTNILKIVALFSTPFEYTLYLDGDTAPCHTFPYAPFAQLNKGHMFITKNPFGYQSTNEKPLYKSAPNHPQYAAFPEPNGGVIGFRWTAQTERWLTRALELIPFFHKLGFDQDQIFMRHALFEEMQLYGLKVASQPMRRYCRTAWNCDLNTCRTGCVIIHQRKCLVNGINYNFTMRAVDESRCHNVIRNVGFQLSHFSRQYKLTKKKLKQQQSTVSPKTRNHKTVA